MQAHDQDLWIDFAGRGILLSRLDPSEFNEAHFVFDSFDELYEYLEALHDGTVEPDYTRWVFFDKV